MNAIALSQDLQRYAGRITDADTHDMLPAQEWVHLFGNDLHDIAEYYCEHGEDEKYNLNTPNVPGFPGDVQSIGSDINAVKGARAPGGTDLSRRGQVMDAMGISRQLMFPTGPGIFAMNLHKYADDLNFMAKIGGDRRAKAKRWIQSHNDWMIETTKTSNRTRPVPVLFGATPGELIARADDLLKRGVRAVWIYPSGELPGGHSPAHPALDPLWARLAEADCAVTVHLAGEGNFFKTEGWRAAPAFEGFVRHGEVNFDPWHLATMHLPHENFLIPMVLGGVFDRHPSLRFGVIECGSFWIGPLLRRLDMWHAVGSRAGDKAPDGSAPTYRLPELPSFYLKRNVRVTPYIFEDFSNDIEWFGIEDMLCFSTDYPHVEGGRDAFDVFSKRIAHLGDSIAEKFFVSNGELLMPA